MATNSRHSFAIIRLFRCITGPKLRRLYNEDRAYTPNKIESYADNVILAAYLLCSFIYHISPFYFVYHVLRNGVPTVDGMLGTFRTLVFIPLSFSIAYVVRGVGRYKNETYNQFLTSLTAAQNCTKPLGPTEVSSTGISGYDFQMKSYPVTFRHSESSVKPRRLFSQRRKGFIEKLLHFPLSTLRYISAHVVARRLVYPGSNDILNLLLETPLSLGRAKLHRNHGAYRAKLQTVDGNHIDTVFVDRRGSPDVNANGNKLMICCEGNAAYYEFGVPEIALGAGYSIIGWNHPGFAESTGLPFPDQEFNAIDVVMRYAITRLGFTFDSIYMFAWSIGGYTASCIAMSYPDIGGVILDATFDELYPLAKLRVPQILDGFTKGMVDEYYNLNIAEQICHYYGPVMIIRRQNDEMMSDRSNIETNRGNYLLIKLLQNRYPSLAVPEALRVLWEWLCAPNEWARSLVLTTNGVSTSECRALIVQYISTNGKEYPWLIGNDSNVRAKTQLLLYLASQYMLHFDSTHCVPIPSNYIASPPKHIYD